MLSYFQNVREEIRRHLKSFFEKKAEEFAGVNSLGRDLCGRLYEFSSQGKMIRGGLVSLAYSLFRDNGDERGVRQKLEAAGAAMELFQSGLLVHDDIMDRDPVRRGLSAVYHQYAEMAEGKGIAGSDHLGESLGICAGDVAFFLAFEILSGIDADPEVHRELLALCARELAYVGVAQMQDVYNAASADPVAGPDIMKLYLYDTRFPFLS
jgi:geranylgeranyl diphosphate synthase type I